MSEHIHRVIDERLGPIPRFKNPPVVETVLGLQFEPIKGFTTAHLGAYWATLDPKLWLETEDAPSIERQIERFDRSMTWDFGPRLRLTRGVECRLKIRNKKQQRMIQIQADRFHLNWLGHGGEPYPSYDTMKPEFVNAYHAFEEFLRGHELDAPEINQWEVTYVNHIDKGSLWESPADWADVFTFTVQPQIGHGPLESMSMQFHYEIEPQLGRLHVDVKHGSSPNGDERIVMTLTARGPVQGDDWGGGLDLGRRAIVYSFKELTSAKACERWGLYYDD